MSKSASGGCELDLRLGPRHAATGWRAFRSRAGRHGSLLGGEAAKHVEPGEIGPDLQTGVQLGLGQQRLAELQADNRREAMGPEIVRFELERGVELLFRCDPIAALVSLLSGQEMIERRRRRESIGRTAFLFGSLRIPPPTQAGAATQMVGPGGRMQSSRLVQEPQALVGPLRRLGQDQKQDMVTVADLVALRWGQARRHGRRCPGVARALSRKNGQRRPGRAASFLQVAERVQPRKLSVVDQGFVPEPHEFAIPFLVRVPSRLLGVSSRLLGLAVVRPVRAAPRPADAARRAAVHRGTGYEP